MTNCMCLSVSLSLYLSICLTVWFQSCLSVFFVFAFSPKVKHLSLNTQFVCLSVINQSCMLRCVVYACPLVRPSIGRFACPSVGPSIRRLEHCPFVHLSVCPSVHLSICPSVRLSVHWERDISFFFFLFFLFFVLGNDSNEPHPFPTPLSVGKCTNSLTHEHLEI